VGQMRVCGGVRGYLVRILLDGTVRLRHRVVVVQTSLPTLHNQMCDITQRLHIFIIAFVH
jgi:hypothetical protein